jgi:hypothetical protein
MTERMMSESKRVKERARVHMVVGATTLGL